MLNQDNACQGFTLIELITVILILGVLAAIAAPKFVNVTGAARASALSGLRAAVSSASTLANALQVAQGLASGSSVTVEGQAIAMTNTYPQATAGGIGNAVRVDSATFSSSSGGATMTFQVATAGTPSACQFTYTSAPRLPRRRSYRLRQLRVASGQVAQIIWHGICLQ